MNRADLVSIVQDIYSILPQNVSAEDANAKDYPRLFDAPIIGFGSAEDPLFEDYKNDGVIGPWHRTPHEWLASAHTVVSLFFTISEEIRRSNREKTDVGSVPWSWARVEGQEYIAAFMAELSRRLAGAGVQTCVPAIDKRFCKIRAGKGNPDAPDLPETVFGSNWSERHAAYACGLGTFGLSKGLITRKGMAGRFGSILLDAELPVDERPYTGIYDYCVHCGLCADRCPVHAISLSDGKNHNLCMQNVDYSQKVLAPRYGCGLCQTGVPCEDKIPLEALL